MISPSSSAAMCTAALYACRDILVRVHGRAEYLRQIADPVRHLTAIAKARGASILATAIELGKEAPRETTLVWIFAAAVEALDPLSPAEAEVPA